MSFHLFTGTDTYLVTPELRDAVNVACALEKPLLIRGEPGTGKTVLAEAIAENLGKPLLTWNIKSTTKAQDGLYVYDTVQRLNDARFGDRDISDIRQYIKFGPLGRALRAQERVVLLIDEIDKADMEFPNDLLHELDRMSFAVVGDRRADHRRASADRGHHVQQREGAARRVPAPLRLPLHRLPGQGDDDRHRAGASSRRRRRTVASGACSASIGCAICPTFASAPRPAS